MHVVLVRCSISAFYSAELSCLVFGRRCVYFVDCTFSVAEIAQSVERFSTPWSRRGWNRYRGEIFCTCLDRPPAPTNPPTQWVKVKENFALEQAVKGVEVYLYSFFNLGVRLVWVNNATLRSLYPLKETQYSLYRRLGVPQTRYERVRQISLSSGFDPRTVQPMSSSYPDYAILQTGYRVITGG